MIYVCQVSVMLIDSTISLNPAQQFIVDAKMLETGFSCILQLPTGTGKTWLSKKAIWQALKKSHRAIYLTPLRALANELHPLWQTEFSPHEVGIFTGDYGQGGQNVPVPFADAKVLIMTPERLDSCTRSWRSHWHWIPEVDLIVIDEVHILGDRHRGARLEGAISRFRRLNPFSRYLCLSATLGNRGQLADWLQGIEFESKWRPVPLSWRIARYRKADQKPAMLAQEIFQTRKAGGRSLVFVQSRRRCEMLSSLLKNQGICADYHHAGLTHKKRRSIEKTFRSSGIDALIATGTLEMGLNMPVRQVILYDTQAYDGSQFVPLSVNTVWQRAGRAGRPGLDSSGEAVLFAAAWDKSAQHYPKGKFEEIESASHYPEALAEQIIAEVGSGLCRSELQLERAMNKSLAVFQRKAMPVNKIIGEMISADMIRSIESDDGGNKNSNRLTTTPLGRIATRHLLQPLTVMMVRDLFQNLPDFTYFDALFALALTPDCEPVIPVDFEELPILAQQLEGIPSFVFFQLRDVRKWLMNPSGKRVLSALKTAAMFLVWCKDDDEDTVADEFSVYTFELTRLQESFNRLLTAATAISNYVLEDPKNALKDEPPEKPEATQRLELLRHMVISTLPSESASLAFVKGIGTKWARKLRDNGYTDIHALSSATLEPLGAIPGLSLTRAKQWIAGAKAMASKPVPSTESTAPLIECELPFTKRETYDPYRLRRAMELTISPKSKGRYIVSGGLEPHRVHLHGDEERCDCADFAKGNICKHIIAVRRHQWQSDYRKNEKQQQLLQDFSTIDLFDLWFES
jgi:ATP-dependent DNA helicase